MFLMKHFKNTILYIDTRLPWGNSRDEMFESVSRLMRFGVYFEITLNRNDYFHVEIHINYCCTYMLGGSGPYASSRRKF